MPRRWTPLPSPFDEAVARAYVERARAARADGTRQLAITVDGGAALGEVLLFPTERKGYVLDMATWERPLGGARDCSFA